LKDTKALDLLLADTLVYTDYDGTLMDKAQFLASVGEGSLHPQQIVDLSTKVQMYGEAAVVTGTYRETGTFQGKTLRPAWAIHRHLDPHEKYLAMRCQPINPDDPLETHHPHSHGAGTR
jgi:hypothetical protein